MGGMTGGHAQGKTQAFSPSYTCSASMEQLLEHAVQVCPFLASLSVREGPSFAKAFALNPTITISASTTGAAGAVRRPLLEDLDSYDSAHTCFNDYVSTYTTYHGAKGVLPLERSCQEQGSPVPVAAPLGMRGRPLPLATLSLSSFGNLVRVCGGLAGP